MYICSTQRSNLSLLGWVILLIFRSLFQAVGLQTIGAFSKYSSSCYMSPGRPYKKEAVTTYSVLKLFPHNGSSAQEIPINPAHFFHLSSLKIHHQETKVPENRLSFILPSLGKPAHTAVLLISVSI